MTLKWFSLCQKVERNEIFILKHFKLTKNGDLSNILRFDTFWMLFLGVLFKKFVKHIGNFIKFYSIFMSTYKNSWNFEIYGIEILKFTNDDFRKMEYLGPLLSKKLKNLHPLLDIERV